MANSFLEEQLQRMRQLTERMAQVTREMAESSEAAAREHHQSGPLDVRDYRTHQTHNYPDRAHDRPARRRRRKKR